MTRVLVTELEYAKAEQIFSTSAGECGLECLPAPREEQRLAEAVRSQGAVHVVVGVDPFAGSLYEALPAGGVIARFGVGHDGIDKERATAHGLLCTNTPGTLDNSVAEHAIALLLAAARSLPDQVSEVRAGTWMPKVGVELRGKVLAIIGCGAIGQQVGHIARAGFGMRVVGCERDQESIRNLPAETPFEEVTTEFAKAVANADFVSLHIPSNSVTRHFMDAARLALLPKKAWLVNTARGAVVDEAALFDALRLGLVAGAALDVFEAEPYAPVDPDRDLRTLGNAIMTPHIGSGTAEACERMARSALRNILHAERAQFSSMDLLNPQVLA